MSQPLQYCGKNFYAIRRSKILIRVLVFIYGGAEIAVLLSPFHIMIKLLLLGFCSGAFLYQYWRNVLFGGERSIIFFTYDDSGKWLLCNKRRHIITASLQRSSVVLPYLTVLHFKVEQARFLALLIFCDAMSKESFRQLRVSLLTASRSRLCSPHMRG